MAALTGNKIQDTFKDLLQVSNSNSGVDTTLRAVSDGEDTASSIQISTTDLAFVGTGAVDLNGKELVLDADADSSITVDTDDVLHMRLQAFDAFIFDGDVASPVNGLTFQSSATGADVVIATHGETNVDVDIQPAGTGKLLYNGSEVSTTASGGTPGDNTVGLAQMAHGTDGNLITYDAAGAPAFVATGTAGHVLVSGGAGVAPTITQVDTAGIAAGAVDTTEIADNAVSLAKMAHGTDGNLITYDATGAPAAVATGNSGEVLTSNGAGAAPTFQSATGGLGTDFFATNAESESVAGSSTITATLSELDDPGADYDPGTGIYTATNAGTYIAFASIILPTGTTIMSAGLAKNGTAMLMDHHSTRISGGLQTLAFSQAFVLAASDTLRLRLTNDNASAASVTAQWGAYRLGA